VTEKPKIFKYWKGGFTGPNVNIEWVDEELRICRGDFRTDPLDESTVTIIVPSLKAWSKFQEDLDRLDFWKWQKKYVDEHIFDGTQIEIDIKFTRRKKVFFSNKFPEELLEFKNSLEALLEASNLWDPYP